MKLLRDFSCEQTRLDVWGEFSLAFQGFLSMPVHCESQIMLRIEIQITPSIVQLPIHSHIEIQLDAFCISLSLVFYFNQLRDWCFHDKLDSEDYWDFKWNLIARDLINVKKIKRSPPPFVIVSNRKGRQEPRIKANNRIILSLVAPLTRDHAREMLFHFSIKSAKLNGALAASHAWIERFLFRWMAEKQFALLCSKHWKISKRAGEDWKEIVLICCCSSPEKKTFHLNIWSK